MAVRVPLEQGEEARARMLELHPEGFEEREVGGALELAAYTDAQGAERARSVFGEVSATPVAEDWADRWRDFHRPVTIGPLWIGPPWLAPPQGGMPVVIDPGRAFGTGAHPTTQLCLGLLVELDRGSLLDIGCGSGVLAIAASRLGFSPVAAIDADPAAIEAIRVNAAVNGVRIEVELRDALSGDPLPAADVAVANIAADAVQKVAAHLRSPLFVASGYLEQDEVRLPGFRRVERRTSEGWAADVYEHV